MSERQKKFIGCTSEKLINRVFAVWFKCSMNCYLAGSLTV